MNRNSTIRSRHRHHRSISVRFLLSTLGITVVVALAVYLVHRWQVDRNADVFRERAEAARKDGQSGQAIADYTRYLGFRPDDTDARAELGILIHDTAKSGNSLLQAYLTYEKVLLQDDDRDEIRDRLVDVAMKLGRFSDAESHILRLLPSAANKAELEYKLGVCAEFRDKPELAEELYQKAIEQGYQKPAVFLQLVGLLNRELAESDTAGTDRAGSDRAERLVDQMIEANPESVEAILVRAELRIGKGQIEEARKDLARANELDPGNVEAVLLGSRIPVPIDASSAEAMEAIRSDLKRALERMPADSRLYQRLAQLELTVGNQEAAIQALSSGIAVTKSPAELLSVLGELLISQGRLSEAEEQLQRLKQLDGTAIFVDFLNARLHLAKGELPEALRLFRKVQPQVDEVPRLLESCSLYLASCYEAMGEPDEQIRELRNALSINPQGEQTALRLGAALQANGKVEEALGVYRQLSQLPGVSLEITRLEFQKTLRQPPEKRDWSRLEAMVQQLTAKEVSVPVALMQQQILLVQGRQAEALDLLKKLHAESPSEEVTGRLSEMLMAQGDLKTASRVIDETQAKLGDTVALRINRALLAIESRELPAVEALDKLELGSDAFSKDDQFRLFSALADLHDLRGSPESASRLRSLAAEMRPHHLQTRIRMFESAAARGHMEDAAKHLLELRQITGTDSPEALSAEAWLLVNADNPSQADLDKACTLLAEVALRRPDWSRVPLLLAVVNEREGNLDLARQKYREAIELGDREPGDIARAMNLCSRLERLDEMEYLLERLSMDSPPSIRTLLCRMKAEVALNRGDSSDALKLVGEAVPKDSRNPPEQIWLGTMLERLRLFADAEGAYREAVRLDATEANSWIALISFLSRRKQSFETELDSARQQLADPGDSSAFARLFEVAWQFDEAEKYYQQQLEKDRLNAGAIQGIAGFYQRTAQADKAEPFLRFLLDPDRKYRQPVVLQARRSLAGILAARDYQGFQEALTLLDANLAVPGDRTTDLLAKASILSVRTSPSQLRDAMLLLQELDRKQALNSQGRSLLAQLCDALGERETASQHWQKLLASNAESRHLVMYIRRQLKYQDLDDIPPLLQQLQTLDPDAFAELTFRWQVQSGDSAAGIETLTQYLSRTEAAPNLKAGRMFQVAELVERVASGLKQDSQERQQLLTASETWYRQILDTVPEATLALARLLGRSNRISEALQLCDGARAAQSSFQVCGIAMQIVRQPGTTSDDVAQVEQWLKDAITEDPTSPIAQVQLGEFGLLHERYQQSFDIYERLLQQSPDHVIALNNLAWLLSMWKGEHEQAEKLVDRAIRKAGPIAALLDTRGTIRLNIGRFDQAIADLRDAVATDDSSSNRAHLAVAFWKNEDELAAMLNFRAAIDAGFRFEDLLPLEQQAFRNALVEMRDALAASP